MTVDGSVSEQDAPEPWAELRNDLRELADYPLSYGQETHGELHAEALRLLDVRERDLDAAGAVLRKWSAEKLRLKEALMNIAEKARWYADNDQRDSHEVDHALCVEVLALADEALGAANSHSGPA